MRKVIYWNYHYKPAGIYATSAEYVQASSNQQARYTTIYPDLVSTLPIPRQLHEALPPHILVDEVAEEGEEPVLRTKTNYGVVEIPDGRLYSDNLSTIAIISGDNKLIGDVSYEYVVGPRVRPEDCALFKQRFFVKPVKYPGVVFNLFPGGGGVSNYFHWLIDVLPRIHLLRQAGLFDKVDWFVVPSYKISFQKETLSLLGIPPDKIIEGTDQLHIQADLLVSSSHPRGEKSHIMPNWLVQFYRDTFMSIPSGKLFPPYVYVSRRDSSMRQVTNEAALIELLKLYGFEVYELSKLSFLEKKDLFAHARVVVSASGAGLTNVLFCQPGATLVEFFPEGFVNTHYYDLARANAMHHYFLLSKSLAPSKTAKKGQSEDLTIDLPALQEILDELFVRETQSGIPNRQSASGSGLA